MTASLPRNELEEKLLDAREGRCTKEEFVSALLESELYVLMDRPPDDLLAAGDPEVLMVTDGLNQEQLMLAIFSEASRAREYAESDSCEGEFFPAAMEAPWAFIAVPDGAGMVFNPNCDLNYRFSPEVAAKLHAFYSEQIHL